MFSCFIQVFATCLIQVLRMLLLLSCFSVNLGRQQNIQKPIAEHNFFKGTLLRSIQEERSK